MATTTARTTHALDPETVALLERLARQWSVSKWEALRRAIRATAAGSGSSEPEARLAAWRQLQVGLALTAPQTRRWERQVLAERRAWRQSRG